MFNKVMSGRTCRRNLLPPVLVILALSGCGGGSSSESNNPGPGPGPGPGNTAPTISGVPVGSVVHSTTFSFIPSASDANGDALTFSISGRPPWASFDSATGRLQGMPAPADLGVYPGIEISVSDGSASASLPAFEIDVVATASGALTISWVAPMTNQDGSTLNDLGGYRIKMGTQSGNHVNVVEVDNPGLDRFVVGNLVPAEYFVVISAVDTSDNESADSSEISGVVQ